MPVRTREGTPKEVAGRAGPDQIPGMLYIKAPGYDAAQCRKMANAAVLHARKISPKLSGTAARLLRPASGEGWFGITWPTRVDYIWFQEQGTRPYTMRSLAGKTVPMWINDPTGKVARENPKAEKRITLSGKRQVKIFRKAAKIGQRKRVAVRDASGRLVRWRDAPASYPGAPGRIGRRTEGGKIVTHPPSGHVGVRWRNPGIHPRVFIERSLQHVARRRHFSDHTVYVEYRRKGQVVR